MRTRLAVMVMVAGLVAGACGGSGSAGDGIDIPDGVTFCSAFTDEFMGVVMSGPADPETLDRFVYWAEVLVALAPEPAAGSAADNLQYARDMAEGRQPAEATMEGSLTFVEWASEHCRS